MLKTYRGRYLDKRGSGSGADYLPYYYAREVDSSGTCAEIVDWKHGRSVQCLSQSEAYWYYMLRWDDNVEEIREQFPLPRLETERICREAGWEHPKGIRVKRAPLDDYLYYQVTTDFLVIYKDGSRHAYSVKYASKAVERSYKTLYIEKKYWESQGVEYTVLYSVEEDKNPARLRNKYVNLGLIMKFYNPDSVTDARSAVLHLIAVKRITVDLETKILMNDDLDYIAEEIRRNGDNIGFFISSR